MAFATSILGAEQVCAAGVGETAWLREELLSHSSDCRSLLRHVSLLLLEHRHLLEMQILPKS